MSKLITVTEDYLHRKLTDEEVEQLLKLRDLRDEDIDTSDIPEITEIPPASVRGKFYRGPMITLKPEVHEYFRTLAARKGVPLNDLVNDVLSREIAIVEAMK